MITRTRHAAHRTSAALALAAALALTGCGSDGLAGTTTAAPRETTSAPADDVESLTAQIEAAGDPSGEDVDALRQELHDAVTATDDEAAPTADADEITDTIDDPDGGFTWSPVTGEEPEVGFAVSPYPQWSEAFPSEGLSDEELATRIAEYAQAHADALDDEGRYLGGWNDPADGTVYLDVSVVTDDVAQARDLAEQNDQISFFDLQTMTSVTVGAAAS